MDMTNLQIGSKKRRPDSKGLSQRNGAQNRWAPVGLSNVPVGYRLAFFGPMCSGKTECANYLVQNFGYIKLSLAHKLKAIAYELYGVEGKNGDNRRVIQELGDALRKFDDDVFTKYTLSTINKNYPFSKVVVDDLRLPREAELLKRNGFYLVQVQCDEEVRLGRIKSLYPDAPESRQRHPTEVSWSGISPHTYIRSVQPSDLIDLDSLACT